MEQYSQNSFSYRYSVSEHDELEKIKAKYSKKEKQVNPLDEIKALDKKVTSRAIISSLTVGIIGCLVMGAGMSYILINSKISILSLIIGIIGLITVILAYPVYKRVLVLQKDKYGPVILKMTDELLSSDPSDTLENK